MMHDVTICGSSHHVPGHFCIPCSHTTSTHSFPFPTNRIVLAVTGGSSMNSSGSFLLPELCPPVITGFPSATIWIWKQNVRRRHKVIVAVINYEQAVPTSGRARRGMSYHVHIYIIYLFHMYDFFDVPFFCCPSNRVLFSQRLPL